MCQYENQEQAFYRQIGPIYYNDKDFIIGPNFFRIPKRWYKIKQCKTISKLTSILLTMQLESWGSSSKKLNHSQISPIPCQISLNFCQIRKYFRQISLCSKFNLYPKFPMQIKSNRMQFKFHHNFTNIEVWSKQNNNRNLLSWILVRAMLTLNLILVFIMLCFWEKCSILLIHINLFLVRTPLFFLLFS